MMGALLASAFVVVAALPVRAAPASTPDITGVVRCSCTPMWSLVEGKRAVRGATYCDPTQEKLTLVVLMRGRRVPADATCDSPQAAEVLCGARWADDPDGELARNPMRWAADFRAAERRSARGATFGPGAPLLARMQFGDLQAVNARAAIYGESPWLTYTPLIRWSEFLYRVALGDIAGSTRLGKVPVGGFARQFPRRGRETVDQLFGVTKSSGDVRARALGALLHQVEDAFLPGHVLRDLQGGIEGNVLSYRSFSKTASDHHRQDTGWRAAYAAKASIWQVQGAQLGVQRATDIVWLLNTRRPWPVAKKYFDLRVFSIAGPPPPWFKKPGKH